MNHYFEPLLSLLPSPQKSGATAVVGADKTAAPRESPLASREVCEKSDELSRSAASDRGG